MPNGFTASHPRYGFLVVEFSKRGTIGGWSIQSTWCLRRWFYSVDGAALDVYGYVILFMVCDFLPTAADWTATRDRFFRRMRRSGLVRGQWLTEWQRRGVPHMHGCLFLPESNLEEFVTDHWLEAVAEWRPGARGQVVKSLWGLPGWF
jgi:hypothetical protein